MAPAPVSAFSDMTQDIQTKNTFIQFDMPKLAMGDRVCSAPAAFALSEQNASVVQLEDAASLEEVTRDTIDDVAPCTEVSFLSVLGKVDFNFKVKNTFVNVCVPIDEEDEDTQPSAKPTTTSPPRLESPEEPTSIPTVLPQEALEAIVPTAPHQDYVVRNTFIERADDGEEDDIAPAAGRAATSHFAGRGSDYTPETMNVEQKSNESLAAAMPVAASASSDTVTWSLSSHERYQHRCRIVKSGSVMINGQCVHLKLHINPGTDARSSKQLNFRSPKAGLQMEIRITGVDCAQEDWSLGCMDIIFSVASEGGHQLQEVSKHSFSHSSATCECPKVFLPPSADIKETWIASVQLVPAER
jgi:hypothetical protein